MSQSKEGWREYHPDMVNKMAATKLREAMRCKDRQMLQQALKEYKACDTTDKSSNDVVKAEHMLKVLEAKDRLNEAVVASRVEAIYAEIDNIKEKNYLKYLQNEVREAEHAAMSSEERIEMLHNYILDMDKRTMSEIRRYTKPPEIVHEVMQSMLLLLGEDEEATELWKTCQKLCNPQGHNGLNRRVMEMDVNNLHPEIVARAKTILTNHNLKQVHRVSSGTGTFYVWTMGIIEEAEAAQQEKNGNDDSLEDVAPADIYRQQELFGRLPEPKPGAKRRRRKTKAT